MSTTTEDPVVQISQTMLKYMMAEQALALEVAIAQADSFEKQRDELQRDCNYLANRVDFLERRLLGYSDRVVEA